MAAASTVAMTDNGARASVPRPSRRLWAARCAIDDDPCINFLAAAPTLESDGNGVFCGADDHSAFWRFSMSLFKLPLSGDVTQWISPITSWWSGNNITVNLGEAGSPETEAEILRRVGSYGRQLGKITDAMIVLLRHMPADAKLTQQERDAIALSTRWPSRSPT
jgi:hypothetical protein